MEQTHEFFYIVSRWPISTIFTYIASCGLSTEDCFVRVVHDKSGRETNRNMAYLPKDAIDRLPELDIKPYKFQDHLIPKDGFTQNFYVPFPKKLTLTIDECRGILSKKLHSFVKTGLISESNYKLQVPFKSRQFGTFHGAVFVLFTGDVDTKVLAKIRGVVDYSQWKERDNTDDDPKNYIMRCLWARESRNRIKRRIREKDGEEVDENTQDD